VPMHAVIEFL